MFHIPVMQIYTAIFGVLLASLCFALLFKASDKSKRFLWALGIISAIVFCVNTVADYYVISQITEGEDYNLFSMLVLAVFHSLELFVFQTHFFDNGYQEFFFGTADGRMGHPWLAFLFALCFILACFVSASLVIRAFNRKRAGRKWLENHQKESGNSHLFFMGSEVARVVAQSIKDSHPDHHCIFIGFPDPEENYMGLSVWEKIQRLFEDSKESDSGPFSAVVYSRVPLGETNGVDICKKMDLKDLDPYLKDGSCKVYLLSDDDGQNLHCAEILHKYFHGLEHSAEIFCRTCREGINRMYESAMANTPSMNIHLVDTATLAVQTLKNEQKLLPVNFVEKGTDADGRPEGWAASPFEAMILGFGETGQEMLGFLYEYGAFVDKDFGKSPFRCTILDGQMDLLEKTYRIRHRGMNEEAGVSYRKCAIGSNEFWDTVTERLPSLNYVAICLGDDRLNLRLALDLAEFACRAGKDLTRNFIILANQEMPTYLDETTLDLFERIEQYSGCVHTFGTLEDVWTYDHITGESMRDRAKEYYDGYNEASGSQGDWVQREREILTTEDYKRHSKLVRQRSQDYANCQHAMTKLLLTDPALLDCRKEIAKDIPSRYQDEQKHYTGTDPHIGKMLHYLAVQEHLRWEASHTAMGYVYGDETDDVRKIHNNIKPFGSLDAPTRHYDYLVVKATYELY